MSDFNKHVGKRIPKDEADKLMERWKRYGLKTQSSFFGSDLLNSFLQQDNVIGLRINYGLDKDGHMAPVLTPVFGSDDAALKTASSTKLEEYGDASFPCPPYCP